MVACHFNGEPLTTTLSAPQESMYDELLRKGLPQVSSIPLSCIALLCHMRYSIWLILLLTRLMIDSVDFLVST
jgi:hypothetical protein